MYLYIEIHIYIYIYTYRARERGVTRASRRRLGAAMWWRSSAFHQNTPSPCQISLQVKTTT